MSINSRLTVGVVLCGLVLTALSEAPSVEAVGCNGVSYSPAYDLDRDGVNSVVDLSLVAGQLGAGCAA